MLLNFVARDKLLIMYSCHMFIISQNYISIILSDVDIKHVLSKMLISEIYVYRKQTVFRLLFPSCSLDYNRYKKREGPEYDGIVLYERNFSDFSANLNQCICHIQFLKNRLCSFHSAPIIWKLVLALDWFFLIILVVRLKISYLVTPLNEIGIACEYVAQSTML